MSKFNSNVTGNYLLKVDGNIVFKLQDIINKNGITKYKLSRITNIRYDTICNYCKGNVTLVNTEYLKIFCSVLNCNIQDIIEFKDESSFLLPNINFDSDSKKAHSSNI